MKKRYNGEDGSEVDALEEANNRPELTPRRVSLPPRALKEMGDASAAEEAGQFGDAGTSRVIKATPKAMPKAKPERFGMPKSTARDTGSDVDRMAKRGKPAATPVDVTKLSVAERRKMGRDNPSVGGPTDRRSVGERLKSAFGMKSGGSVGSASRRADGIATKGKTRGKMC
jgi:hypothetical protein